MATKTRRTKKKTPVDQAPQVPAVSYTLDDAVSFLLQVELSDTSGFARLRTALESVAAGDTLQPAAHGFMREAMAEIDRLLAGETSDGEDVLIRVSRLLEAASEAGDRQDPSLPATAATEAASAARTTAEVFPVFEETAGASPESAGELTATGKEAAWSGVPEACAFDPLPPDADRDLLGEFVTESQEFIEGAEAALLSLETAPDNQEAINSVFRAFHTIKGTSGFLGLTRVSELAHRAESLLSRVRDREIQCTGKYADLTLRSIDVLKGLMVSVRNALQGNPMVRPVGYDALLKDLANPDAAQIAGGQVESPRLGDILIAQGVVDRDTIEAIAETKGDEPLGLATVRSEAASLTDVAKALRVQQRQQTPESGNDTTLRVRTDRLDRLIDTVGELVIAQSMVAQDRMLLHESLNELLRKVMHAGKIVRELQDLSMSMRMVPLRATFQKMHRLVRDLAHKSNKKVDLITEDGDTEIDRHMVDIINDLLVHMVRNSVDHGIEPPDVRVKNGKNAAGTVRLTAFHSGGSVVVEIRDDGRGLDRKKIIQKAISTGLIVSDKGMSDSEAYNLIFAPGFSTADKITDISGRGVGMDVVRKGVETLHGRIEVSTIAGYGSTFSVRLPLTLAITDGMLVKVGPDRYIIPTNNIHLCFRPQPEQLSTVGGRGEMVLLRGELMPIFRLHRLFNIQGAIEDPTAALLVVVGDGDRRCSLLVDELLGQQQFVAKSLGDGVGRVQGVSGGAIMGDGRVGLILDPSGIAALARQNLVDREASKSFSRPAA